MTVKSYAYAMMQLEIQGVLHIDTHMFAQEDLYQVEPGIVVAIITQI